MLNERARPAPASQLDIERRCRAILASPTFRLAEEDAGFMESEAARPSRLALEFMRVEACLREQQIRSTVVVFGSSHIVSPEVAHSDLEAALAEAALAEGNGQSWTSRQLEARVAHARTALAFSRYYDEARTLGGELARANIGTEGHEFVVATGGGPGIMEAANRGAAEAGAPTIGFNIRLPDDQPPNAYITPALAFRFHYFALRKMHFLLRARALVAFPGGFGTLDELFESLNLVQTRIIAPIPIVLVGIEHWRRTIDLDYLVAQGLISANDRELITVVDSGAEAARRIRLRYGAEGSLSYP